MQAAPPFARHVLREDQPFLWDFLRFILRRVLHAVTAFDIVSIDTCFFPNSFFYRQRRCS